jgi:hypothetical protein
MSSSAFSIQNLNFYYGQKIALSNISMEIPPAPGDRADRSLGMREVHVFALSQPHE